MKRVQQGCAAIVLLASSFASLAASPPAVRADCPDLSSLQAAAGVDAERSPEQLAADQLVTEADANMRAISDVNLAKAISQYEQAIAIDAHNAPAYFHLARAHLLSRRYLSVKKPEAHARAWTNLARGRALAPADSDGLYLLADQVFLANHDYECAKGIFETALQLEPGNALTHYWYSELLSGMGKFEQAFAQSEQALALADADTRDYVVTNTGRQRYMAGQYDWVLAHYENYLEAKPGYWLAHFYRSLAFGAKGEFDTALLEARKAMPDAPRGDAGGIGMLALAYADAGQDESAREMLQELLDRDARGEHVVEYRIAVVYEALGERDLALQWLGKQIDDRDGIFSWLLWLNHDPAWKAMRKDPRFTQVQRRAGW